MAAAAVNAQQEPQLYYLIAEVTDPDLLQSISLARLLSESLFWPALTLWDILFLVWEAPLILPNSSSVQSLMSFIPT